MPLRPPRFVTFRLALGKALVLSLGGIAPGHAPLGRAAAAPRRRAPGTLSRSRVSPMVLLVPRKARSRDERASVEVPARYRYVHLRAQAAARSVGTAAHAQPRGTPAKRAATQHLLSDHVGQALQELGPFYKQKL